MHFAANPHGSSGNQSCLPPAFLGKAHFGKEQRQMALLKLARALTSQEVVEMLAGPREWLPRCKETRQRQQNLYKTP